MIISHKYRFIFIKTHKTAGTSIEIALSEFCGGRDVITPVGHADEAIRQTLGYPSPQNFCLPYSKYGLADWIQLVVRREKLAFYNHIPARVVRPLVGEAVWTEYYKFCLERNPWDKALSYYYWTSYKKRTDLPLSQFILSGKANEVSDFGLYTIDSEIAVDHIGRYENLEQELEGFSDRVGLPKLQLPRAKSNARKDRRHYSEVLNDEEREKIACVFAREIACLGYRF